MVCDPLDTRNLDLARDTNKVELSELCEPALTHEEEENAGFEAEGGEEVIPASGLWGRGDGGEEGWKGRGIGETGFECSGLGGEGVDGCDGGNDVDSSVGQGRNSSC